MIATTTLFILINSVRITPLTYDPKIEKVAMTRCLAMKEWSHKGFPYKEIFKLRYFRAGENLAKGFPTATSTMQGFQSSPTHKANNEYTKYQNIGIANCNNTLGNTTVVLFGGK